MTNRNTLIGYALVAGGGLFLLGRLFDWEIGASSWPLFILVPGIAFLYFAATDRACSSLFIPGCILTTLSLIFFVQSATDHYESWAYVWALLWAATGLGMFLQGEREGNSGLTGQGKRLMGIAGAAFAVSFVFFEGFIFGDLGNSWLFRTGLPLLFIVAGGYLLYRQSNKPQA